MVVAFTNKRKRMDYEDNQIDIIQSMQTTAILAYEYEFPKRVWGSDKQKEMPRERKNFELDIALPLSPAYFQRLYCMTKESFYILFFILEPELKKEFFISESTTFDKRRKSSCYYIDLKIRLSAAI